MRLTCCSSVGSEGDDGGGDEGVDVGGDGSNDGGDGSNDGGDGSNDGGDGSNDGGDGSNDGGDGSNDGVDGSNDGGNRSYDIGDGSDDGGDGGQVHLGLPEQGRSLTVFVSCRRCLSLKIVVLFKFIRRETLLIRRPAWSNPKAPWRSTSDKRVKFQKWRIIIGHLVKYPCV
ncbi:hypothetical protein ElyMa_002254800 [Elysia marginata]|uniref:Uncharacterized protein n=1 Tax=Elysia marginata TaxID=1093978 RepID=A0AAV4FYL6_9GAST|nr:hypothetical protein ElyMa_002254800 [Elysia marginata]